MIHGTREDLIWLAGLLEGEGTFDLHRGRYPRIRLAMTDRDVVGRAATLLGASIRGSLRARPYRSTWHTEISGERAAAVMREVLPFMGARRSAKIAEVLGEYAFQRDGSPTIPAPRLTRPPGFVSPSVSRLQ